MEQVKDTFYCFECFKAVSVKLKARLNAATRYCCQPCKDSIMNKREAIKRQKTI